MRDLIGHSKVNRVVLVSISVLMIAGFAMYPIGIAWHIEWMHHVSLHLGFESLGILVTVVLIDGSIRKAESDRAERGRALAFASLEVPLEKYIGFWKSAYRGCISAAPNPVPTTVQELFSEEFFEQVRYLDCLSNAPFVTPSGPIDWSVYAERAASELRGDIDRALSSHGHYLDLRDVETIQKLRGHPMLNFLQTLALSKGVSQSLGTPPIRACFWAIGRLIQEHADLVIALVNLHDATRPTSPVKMHPSSWRSDIAPPYGSCRLLPALVPSAS